jgi:urease accessory protein
MYDAAFPSEAAGHQRARGALRLGFGLRDGATVLRDLYQQGCLKVRFPRPENGAWTTAVLLNTSGGIAGGDRMAGTVVLAAGTRATVTTQAAERVYRALPDSAPAAMAMRVTLGEGAALDWLPQETILFDRAAFGRTLDIDMAATAEVLVVEQIVLGRAAMGETVRQLRLRDLIRVRRAGRLVLHDALRVEGDAAATLAGRAAADGGAAVATLALVRPGAEAMAPSLREALAGADAGVSAGEGLLVARIVARDGACLRAAVVAGLAALRGGRTLPRVWLT